MSNIYGDWLKAQRKAADMTQQELAVAAIMTRSHIAHIEAGRRVPSKEDARRLDMALGTGDVLSSFLPKDDHAVAEYFEAARQLEQQATMIHEFAPAFVPGILQTRRYADAVMRTAFPPWSKEERDRLVGSRLDRAKILDTPATPVVWALLDEVVLRRPVGGPKAMAEQITHIVQLAEEERVRVHVMPISLGAYHLLQSTMTLMWFEDQPPAAYIEGLSIAKLHDAPDVVKQLQGAYSLALGDALPFKDSLAFMKATAKEYEHHD
ncbi:helix-turn-helix transcriptional regulator [Streptomyces sp. NPDC093109]|uniref:helix-turn-helix domain-containing protein n=1 Tax=Streptomyces sp. NPDC093109 TaxID=3154977 RepID=UPI00344FD2E7